MNSFLNPVIYTIFNIEFRRAFKKILQTPCWIRQFLNVLKDVLSVVVRKVLNGCCQVRIQPQNYFSSRNTLAFVWVRYWSRYIQTNSALKFKLYAELASINRIPVSISPIAGTSPLLDGRQNWAICTWLTWWLDCVTTLVNRAPTQTLNCPDECLCYRLLALMTFSFRGTVKQKPCTHSWTDSPVFKRVWTFWFFYNLIPAIQITASPSDLSTQEQLYQQRLPFEFLPLILRGEGLSPIRARWESDDKRILFVSLLELIILWRTHPWADAF